MNINDTLSFKNNLIINGSCSCDDKLSVNNLLTVMGSLSISDNLSVANNISALSVSNTNRIINNNLSITTLLSANNISESQIIGTNMYVTNNAILNNLSVISDTTVTQSSTISNLHVSNSGTVSINTLAVTGTTSLGSYIAPIGLKTLTTTTSIISNSTTIFLTNPDSSGTFTVRKNMGLVIVLPSFIIGQYFKFVVTNTGGSADIYIYPPSSSPQIEGICVNNSTLLAIDKTFFNIMISGSTNIGAWISLTAIPSNTYLIQGSTDVLDAFTFN
jgi:hypothetical protein